MNKSKASVFPYQSDVKGNLFPLIPISLKYKLSKNDYFALADSGATVSIFRQDVADYFGIEIEKGEEIELRGAGGWFKGYIHKLTAEVAGKRFLCPVVFSRDYQISLNIVGRKGLFDNFKVTFDETKKSVILS